VKCLSIIPLFISFTIGVSPCIAQNNENDWELIRKIDHSSPPSSADLSLVKNNKDDDRGFNFYRTVLKPQLGFTCHFEMTCPVFCPVMIRRYGLLKGYFLSADRLLRCTKISVYETYTIRLTTHRKIKESPDDFHFHP